MNIRVFLIAAITAASLVAPCIAQPVRILLPDAMPRDNADKLALLLKKQNPDTEVVPLSAFASAPVEPAAVLVGMGIGNFAPQVWQKLEEHVKRGGVLVFQGKKENREPLTPEARKALAAIFGAEYLGYDADPLLGKGPVQKYMFIKPSPGETWGAEFPPLFAAYTGEAFPLKPVNGGETVAAWVRRDRTTEDGPAVILKRSPGGGKAVLIGYYPWDLAAKGDRNNLPSFHAGIMLGKFLPVKQPAAPKRYQEPLNTRPVTPAFSTPRSMWMWNIDYALNPTERKKLLDFTTGRHISTLYVCISKRAFAGENRDQLRTFIREANRAGVKVEALDGWKQAILPEQQPKFLESLQRVIDYNLSVAPDERFSGFQSDVEPVTMKEYHASPEAKRRFDRLYVELHAKCAELIRKSGLHDFVFGMAINESLDREIERPDRHVEWNGKTCSVIEHLAGFTDYFALMSYHDTAPKIIRAADGEVDLAAKYNIKAWVGVETLDVMQLFGGSRSLSFYEEGLDYMEKELEKVYRHYSGKPGYGGIAIHHYESYRRMTDGPRNMDLPAPPALTTGKLYRLDSAGDVAYGGKNWNGKDDLGVTFRFGWTPDYLTVEAVVTDDKIVSAFNGEDLWKSDHLEFWFRQADTGRLIQLGVGLSESDNIHAWHPQELTAEQRAALAKAVKTETGTIPGGYEIKCRIPAAFFGLKKFKRGDKLPFLAEVGDTDDAAHAAKTMISTAPARDREDIRTYAVLELTDN